MAQDPNTPLISFVLPSDNGESMVAQTLNSILGQSHQDQIEVVVCDDASADATYAVAESCAAGHGNVRCYRNSANLGMDRNFTKAVAFCRGLYIWMIGQDDVLAAGAVTRVVEVLEQNRDVDFIFVNYGQYTHDLRGVIREKVVPIDADRYFPDYQDFLKFTRISYLPTFLTSYVLRKQMWDSVDASEFYDTHYLLLGILLKSIKHVKAYVISDPCVLGRIPADGWQTVAHRGFAIFSGNLDLISMFKDLFDPEDYRAYVAMVGEWIHRLLPKIRLRSINKRMVRWVAKNYGAGGLASLFLGRFVRHLRAVKKWISTSVFSHRPAG